MGEGSNITSNNSEYLPPSKYDLRKSEFGLQLYFIYKNVKEDGAGFLKDECRNCDKLFSQKGHNTIINHHEKLDEEPGRCTKLHQNCVKIFRL